MIDHPEALLHSFEGKRILIVGDLMLDEFVRGDVRRVSPEAPVPVVDVTSRETRLGGAANAAANVRALGGQAVIVALVGSDEAGEVAESLLTRMGIEHQLVHDSSRPTTRKTRIVARGQQIVRVDSEARHSPPKDALAALLAAVGYQMLRADACILSDYAKGVVTAESASYTIGAGRSRKCPVVVDPKHQDFSQYRGATVLTPNSSELELAAGHAIRSEAEVISAANRLLPELDGAAILATRGADGMSLIQPACEPLHVHALAKTVFDVTGAGDTVVATLALALAAHATWHDALWAASVAAGIVVSKEGTATASPAEIVRAFTELS